MLTPLNLLVTPYMGPDGLEMLVVVECGNNLNGFKQVQEAHLALISYLDRLFKPATCAIQPTGSTLGLLILRLIIFISALIDTDIEIIYWCKDL